MQGARPELYGHTTHELLRWIEDITESCTEISKTNAIRATHHFVPISKINQFLGDINRTRKLLATIGLDATVDARTIANKCPRTFCILIERGKGHLIERFVEDRSLWDDHLPYSKRPEEFPRIAEDPEFFEKFRQSQWRFCAAELDIQKRVKLGSESILPILQKRWLAGGVTADLHHVEIHPDYDLLRGSNPNSTRPREFALKTYRSRNPHAEHYYLTEVENFSRLMVDPQDGEPTPGLIGFYGGFEHNGTYNILLEFADGKTLEEFFQYADPPACGADILAFWKSFREVLKALVNIHQIELNDDDEKGRRVFQGWHQDVKPKNILILSNHADTPYERQFRLGDLGLSHFTRLHPENDDPVETDTMGTRTYGAPEIHRRTDFDETREIKASRAIDIWSLGCVIIEVCVWIIRGKEYLQAFRASRQQANDEFQPSANDCFHNGQIPHPALLDTIQEQFDQLPFERRVSDFVTIEILYHVQGMVRIFPGARPNAGSILGDIDSCISAAESRLSKHNGSRPYCQATLILRPSISAPPEHPSPPPPITPPQAHTRSWQKPKASVSFSGPGTYPVLDRNNAIYSSPQTTGIYTDLNHSPNFYNAFPGNGPPMSAPPHGASFGPPPTIQRNLSGRTPKSTIVFDEAEDPERWTKRGPPQADFGPPIRSSTIGTVTAAETHKEQRSRGQSLKHLVTESEAKPDISQSAFPAGQIVASPSELNSQHSPDTSMGSRGHAVPGDGPIPASSASSKRQSKQRRRKRHTPTLSVARAIAWKADQKKLFGPKTPLDNGHLRNWLKNRDHIFLIDNALSMQPYWQHVVTLIDPLVYLVKQGDPDGVEVFFTNSTDEKKSTNSTHITNFVNSQKQFGRTDIRIRLGWILNRSQKKLHDSRSGSGATPESIYVLTDGAWAGGNDAKPMIKDMVAVLKQYRHERRQIGIQFISFGQDFEGLDRLEDLDDFGKSADVGQDIVDTESSTGNVWKMLLGAIDKQFDEAQSDDEG